MGSMQYEETVDAMELPSYHYRSNLVAAGMTAMVKSRVKRLAQEHSDLSQSLPLSWSSSVWLRVAADRLDALQFVISGPEGTPYSNGLFLFDAFFDGKQRLLVIRPIVTLSSSLFPLPPSWARSHVPFETTHGQPPNDWTR